MSTTIDNRVVEMQFDNRHFEQNVQTSLSTIDKLKRSLNFTGSSKSLENISSAAKKVDMSAMGTAVDGLKLKFSAMEVMAVTALANITNSAVNAGKRIVSALTIDPIKTGLQEYETKINAIQVIKANTRGKNTMDDIEESLEELNKYADKTIYNFAQMTSNVGKFTAQGYKVEEATQAVKGLANLAAASGASAEDMARATYQMSQALSSSIKLMDWNSLRNANMATMELKNTLIDLAKVHGVKIDEMIKKNGSFEQTLSEGWLTGDMFMEAMNIYSGVYSEAELKAKGFTDAQVKNFMDLADTAEKAATQVKTLGQLWDVLKEGAQSGWTKTWELIIGNYDQATELWTGVSDAIGGFINKTAESRNVLLEGAMTSNWDKLIAKVNEAGISTADFQDKVKDVAKNHNVDIDDMIKKYGSLEKVFRSGKVSSDILKEALGGTGEAITETTKEAVNHTVKAGDTLSRLAQKYGTTVEEIAKLNNIKDVNFIKEGQVLKISEAMTVTKESTEGAIESIDDLVDGITVLGGRELLLESFKNIFKTLADVGEIVGATFRSIFPPVTSEQLYSILEKFKELTDRFKLSEEVSAKLRLTFKGLFSVLDIIARAIRTVVVAGLKILGPVVKFIADKLLTLTANVGAFAIKVRHWLVHTTGLTDGLKVLGSILKKVGDAIKKWVKAFLEIPEVQQAIDKVKMALSDMFSGLKKRFAGGVELVKDFVKRLMTMDSISFEDVLALFKNFKDKVIEYFSGIDVSKYTNRIKDGLSIFKEAALKYLGIAGEKFDFFKEKLVAFVEFIKSKIPAAIAIGMGVMLIKGVSKLGKALGTLAAPFDGLKDLLDTVGESISNFMKAKAFREKTEGIKNIAISIGILAASLTVLTMLDQKKLWSAVGALGILTIAMGGLAFVTNKFGGLSDFGKSSTAILALTGSLFILTKCIESLSKIDGGDAAKSLLILAAMTVGLAAVVGALSKFAPQLSTGSLTFISLAAGIAIMVNALKKLDGMELNNAGRSILILLGIVGSLGLLAKACSGVKFGSLAGIIAMTIGLKLMIGVIEDISNIDINGIKNNLDEFLVVFGSLALVMAASKFAGKHAGSAGIGILAMSAALLLLVHGIKGLSEIDQSMLSRASNVLAKLLLVFGAVIAVTSFAGKHAAGAGVTMLAMSASILIMVGAIALLKNLDPDGMDRAMEAIAKLGLIFAGMIIATKFAKDASKLLIPMTVAIGLMAVAIAGLSFIDPDGLKNATTALGTVMGMFALLMGATKLLSGGMGALIVMTGAVTVLAGLILLLSKLPIEQTIGIATSLSILILSLSGACAILALVNPAGALSGVGALAVFITGLAAIMAAIAGLNKLMPGMNEFLESSLPTIELLGKGLGTFFGGIVGGFAEGVTSSFPQIATDLSNFMTNLKPFIDGAKNIDAASMDGVNSVIDVITGLTKASFLEAITSIFTDGSSISTFATELPLLGEGLKQFSDKVVGIDTEAVKAASDAVTTLSSMASNIPNQGGWIAAIVGENDMGMFGTQLPLLGEGLKGFSDKVVGIDTAAVESAAIAAKTLANMSASIPNQGGWIAAIVGENDMATFGTQLPLFGEGIKGFADKVVGIDTAAVESAATATKTLVDMANTIPNQGGWLAKIIGDNDVATFGTQLPLFGQGIKSFADKVAGINTEAVNTAVDAATSLTDMANNLPESGGLWSVFAADNDMSTFASQLKKFGEGIANFSEKVSSINIEAVNTASGFANRMTNLANKIPEGGYETLYTFGGQLNVFGSHLKGFAVELSGVNVESLSSVISEIDKLITTLTSISKNASGIGTSFGESLGKIGKDGINLFIQAFTNSNEKVVACGKAMITAFLKGVTSVQTTLESTFKKIAGSGVTAVRDKYDSYESAGKYVVTGFADGISANTFKAEAKAKAMALAALEAAKEALGIQSPSREFYAAGDFSGMGFVNALHDYVRIAYKAGGEMANSAKNGLIKSISDIGSLINAGIDTQPTIRPVVDLSGVTMGANSINDMLGGLRPSISTMANIGAISSMRNRNQNGANDDVVSAINKLGRQLGNTSSNTYNINGITYDDGSAVSKAIETLVRAATMERRR